MTPSAQTKANDAISGAECPAAGGAVQITLDYGTAPKAAAARAAQLLADDTPDAADCDPGTATGGPGTRVPIVSVPWLSILSALILGVGVAFLRGGKQPRPAA